MLKHSTAWFTFFSPKSYVSPNKTVNVTATKDSKCHAMYLEFATKQLCPSHENLRTCK
jgi:hypothetical protein